MAHGQPDFGIYAPKSTVSGLADLGELAARLFSIDIFDRRGDVVWIDDFGGGLANWTAYYDAGGAVAISGDRYLINGVSCKLSVPNLATAKTGVYRHNPLPVYSRIGVEFAFLPADDSKVVRLDMANYDGEFYYPAYVYIDIATKIIWHYDAGGEWSQLATDVNIRRDGKCWHFMKLVVDLDTSMYVRLILDNVEYDLTSRALRKLESDEAPMLKVDLSLQTNADTSIMYINHVINTQNEP